jgi:hypothetical protein
MSTFISSNKSRSLDFCNYFDFTSLLFTNILNSNTWYKLNTNTTSSLSRGDLIHSNNRVTNTGSKKVVRMEGIISLTAGSNNEIHAAFFKGGVTPTPVIISCSEQSTISGTGNRIESLPFHCVAELDTNEYLEVWVKNGDHVTDLELININVTVQEI